MAKNNQTKDQKKKQRDKRRREKENSKNTFFYLNDVKKSSLVNEDNESLPDSLLALKKHMKGALAGGKGRYGVSDSPESDRFRHMVGMRNAALDPEVGPFMALVGGAGHEVNNLYGAFVDNDLSQLGTASSRLGAGQILKNSSDDMLNNLAGILSAYFDRGEPTEEQLEYFLSFGVLPSDLRKPDSSTIMVDQDK